jgi:hypothetical protein
MQRFKKYIGKDFILGNVKDTEALRSTGFLCDNIPDSMGDFDELEFLSEWDGKQLLMCLAVLTGKVKRIMFVMRNSEDPDDVRPLSEGELRDFLNQKGDQLVSFFESITQ